MTAIERETLIDELGMSHICKDDSEKLFAEVVGQIEDIIISEEFAKIQNDFLEEYWQEFENVEENKLIYTDIFKSYISVIERYIEIELKKAISGFTMTAFEKELQKRQGELDGEIFEILSTFSDFEAFKNMFLDYKRMKEGNGIDFSKDISVSKYHV